MLYSYGWGFSSIGLESHIGVYKGLNPAHPFWVDFVLGIEKVKNRYSPLGLIYPYLE